MPVALLIALAATPVAADELEPVAPRAPGLTLVLIGGQLLTATSAYGGVVALPFTDGPCFGCAERIQADQAVAMRLNARLVTSGMAVLLAGMAWLAWAQPPDQAKPRSPAIAAFLAAALELTGGVAEAVFKSSEPTNPFASDVQRSMIPVIVSGAAALAAGIAWLVWASR